MRLPGTAHNPMRSLTANGPLFSGRSVGVTRTPLIKVHASLSPVGLTCTLLIYSISLYRRTTYRTVTTLLPARHHTLSDPQHTYTTSPYPTVTHIPAPTHTPRYLPRCHPHNARAAPHFRHGRHGGATALFLPFCAVLKTARCARLSRARILLHCSADQRA